MYNPTPFSTLKVAIVSDDLTRLCLSPECRVMNVTPWNGRLILKHWRPDLLLVESAWEGRWNSWKYKIASYPDHPERSNKQLVLIVEAARDANIPSVFWNREDGVHFDRFIDSAKLFDYVFTVDENMIPRYREFVKRDVPVGVLMFAAQPAIHFPLGEVTKRRVSFVGSYGRHVHPARRAWQDMMFQAAKNIGVTVYDRNSSRKAERYRYPSYTWLDVKNSVPHVRTPEIYRRYVANLNVNTVCNSPTAFSRRLVEILACGGFAITNSTPSVTKYFADFCEAVNDEEVATELLKRLGRDGLTPLDRKRMLAGIDYVCHNHTWRHRLEQIVSILT